MPPHPALDAIPLPDGVLWRRAENQLTTRLGVHPGDRVVVLGPHTRDLAASLAARLPRVRFLQCGGADAAPFGWPVDTAPARVVRLQCDPYRPPLPNESLDAVVVLFAFPLLQVQDHRRLVDVWAPRLAPFGKWFSLLALDGPRDDRLASGERDLKEAGFEKVRSMRLALGRMGAALYLQTARWPGLDVLDDEEGVDDEDDEEE